MNALSLYNAVNGSNYTNVDDLTFTTLDDVVYMKMKNDVSFLFDKTLSLYEHQSTYNPNMPLRGFLYFADLYRQLIKDNERIYSKSIVKIPAPHLPDFLSANFSQNGFFCISRGLPDGFSDDFAVRPMVLRFT